MLYHCCTPAQLLAAQIVNLTQSKVDKLQPKDKRYVVKDSGGLSVCVQPSGAKSFQLRYRFHGRQKTLSLGDISLKDARAKAQAARVAIYEGEDPQAKALLRKETQMSFGDFLKQQAASSASLKGINGGQFARLTEAALKVFPRLELFSGWGLYAQNLEGQILKRVMLEGVKKGIVCLPVHDAVAVQQEHLEWAKDTMLECWDRQMETTGLARVKIDLP